jgi:RimJ/RimL family protein N-acetyltransferase/catechol 2,3-dioxygenase-like lactoylglutathione lyase family enzyme
MTVKPQTLSTERLQLTPLDPDDAQDLFAVYSHPEAMRYWDSPPHESVDQTKATILREISPTDSCWWAVREADGPAIGVVGYLGNPGVPGMGYILHPDHWRRGLMSEAVRAALSFGFTTRGLDRTELWIFAQNEASLALAESIGFQRMGRFRQQYHHESRSHEKIVYGLYAHEWLETGQPAAPRFYGLHPVLQVGDIQATAAFYRDVLGFEIDFMYGEPPEYAGISRGDWTVERAQLHIAQVAAPPETAGANLYITVGPELDQLCEQYRQNGVDIFSEPQTFPWGRREFAIRDLNGYQIWFGTAAH